MALTPTILICIISVTCLFTNTRSHGLDLRDYRQDLLQKLLISRSTRSEIMPPVMNRDSFHFCNHPTFSHNENTVLATTDELKFNEKRKKEMERKVYFVTDNVMLLHSCEWDENHIEKPERLSAVIYKLTKTGLLRRCTTLQSRKAEPEDLRLVHSQDYIDRIAATQKMNLEERENLASNYDDVYFNEHSYEAALMGAGCSLQAVQAVLSDPERRSAAFAAVRPPGHHASLDKACGYCIFNNVAICAKKARALGQERVLVIDWDIHAGQGTQYAIADDPKIKLISIHRYEYGTFWPHLPESAISHGYENTINVPLNTTGLGDSEYIAFVQHFVVPVINDFMPSLILISSGFDAAFGDEEGGMNVTPAGYFWMTKLVLDAAISNRSALCMLMEGGYFIDSVAYGAEFCIEALLGDLGPDIELKMCNSDFLHSLHSAVLFHAQQFPSLQLLADVTRCLRAAYFVPQFAPIKREYREVLQQCTVYPTRGLYFKRPESELLSLQKKLVEMTTAYTYGNKDQKTVFLALVQKIDESKNPEEELQIEVEECVLEAAIDFMQIHVVNTPCVQIVLSKGNCKNQQNQQKSNVQKEFYKDERVIGTVVDGLSRLFQHGHCHDLQHFMIFELRLT